MERTIPPDFDWQEYVNLYDDLKKTLKTKEDAEYHWIRYGRKEGRPYKSSMLKLPPDFDWQEYVNIYDDLKKSLKTKEEAEDHWIRYGQREGRVYKLTDSVIQENLPPDFDWEEYISMHDDLRKTLKTKKEAINHWVLNGKREGRQYRLPRAMIMDNNVIPLDFDWQEYVAIHDDLRNSVKTKKDAEEHWLNYGRKENRPYKVKKNKFLFCYAVHLNDKFHYEVIKHNLSLLAKSGIKNFLIILSYQIGNGKNQLKDEFEKFLESLKLNFLQVIKVPNDLRTRDFGKHLIAINYIENNYLPFIKRFVFLNDSFIFVLPQPDETFWLERFLMKCKKYQITGVTDSKEQKYHYQSYMFGLRDRESLLILKKFLKERLPKVKVFQDLITKCELDMIYNYHSHECFVKSSEVAGDKNIFFLNEPYKELLIENTLPIIKIRRLFIHFENRQCSIPNSLPDFLYRKLEDAKLLYLLDFVENVQTLNPQTFNEMLGTSMKSSDFQ